VDKEALNKVIDNLIHNACKYSPSTDPVTVSSALVGPQVHMAISDLGPGIPARERSKIWDKFYRIGNEETRETQGTGLGLWIAKAIINAHKGSISYKDNEPKGSTFLIKLPRS